MLWWVRSGFLPSSGFEQAPLSYYLKKRVSPFVRGKLDVSVDGVHGDRDGEANRKLSHQPNGSGWDPGF